MMRTVWPGDANRARYEELIAQGLAVRDGAGYRVWIREGKDG